jgi:hypothetical protein
MAAAEFSRKRFGRPTRLVVNPLVDSVGTSPVRVLANNPDRMMWLIINLSTNTVYLGFDPQVSSTRGIILGASGGYASMVIEDDGEAVAYEVWAVATGPNSPIYVIEVEAM